MTTMKLGMVIGLAVFMSACGSSPKEKMYEAEAEFIEQKTETLEEYRECLDDAGTDKEEMDACERLLKAVQGLESQGEEATNP